MELEQVSTCNRYLIYMDIYATVVTLYHSVSFTETHQLAHIFHISTMIIYLFNHLLSRTLLVITRIWHHIWYPIDPEHMFHIALTTRHSEWDVQLHQLNQ